MSQVERQGSEDPILKKIYLILISPILKLNPNFYHVQDWLDSVFSVSNRIIKRFVVKKEFKMPGILKETSVMIPPANYREAMKGDQIWMRLDKAFPELIDVELLNDETQKSIVFRLTRYQAKRIAQNLKDLPFRKRRRKQNEW
jgi:hypothetical protein